MQVIYAFKLKAFELVTGGQYFCAGRFDLIFGALANILNFLFHGSKGCLAVLSKFQPHGCRQIERLDNFRQALESKLRKIRRISVQVQQHVCVRYNDVLFIIH